jgi:gentisate 1,2-dioxygenase
VLRPPTLAGLPEAHEVEPGREEALTADGRIYEYVRAANPVMAPQPVLTLTASEHLSGPTRVIPFDLSAQLNTPYPATSPNLLVGFIRIVAGESIETVARATSQAIYVIRGTGRSVSEHGEVVWSAGDMVVLPKCPGAITHFASGGEGGGGDVSLYWASDEPLLKYLGVTPSEATFAPTVIRREQMLAAVETISHEPGALHRNRMGILLGNKVTDHVERGGSGTLTLTPTLWSLLNIITPRTVQRPHRHQSVALDLCVYAKEGVYTLMGPELNADGSVKDPVRCDWATGAVFATPPGWWHSHHNESDEAAWVLPMQDAGLFTYQRALDIRFAPKAPRGEPNSLPCNPPAPTA